MIIDIFLIIASIIISLIGITFISLNRENLGNNLNYYLNCLIYLFLGIFFFTFFLLSTDTSFTESNALIFWKFSILFWVFSLSLLSVVHRFIIKYEKKVIFSTLIYSLVIGIILGLILYSDAFTINSYSGFYSFGFNNLLLLILLLGYDLMIISVFFYNLITHYTHIRDDKSRNMLIILTTQGLAARVFRAVAEENINVEMISAGASEVAYYFIVMEKDLEKAVNAIHNDFFTSDGK